MPAGTKGGEAVKHGRMLAAILGLVGLAGFGPARAETPRTCPGEVVEAELREVTPEGEMLLGSGARLKLVDLRLALPEAGREDARPAAVALLRSFRGQPLAIRTVGPEDRWARRPAEVTTGGAGARIDLAELLVGEGLALIDPGERDALCRPDLLAIEQGARGARRGLWRDRSVLSARDPDALRAALGGFAVVEGRIVSVGERRDRTYLNFGADFARDFAVVVPRRSWDAFKRAGRDAAALKGRRVRVRGLLEPSRAPSMEMRGPDVLELLPDDARRRTEPNL